MKVFISWSGERSQALARTLREWLPLVLYYVDPWLSQQDIEAGECWALEISKELETSNFGIVCITRSNISSPWILFESGALAKSMQQGRVIPLLLNIDFKDITGPLAQFQAKKVDENGLNELVLSINKLAEHPVPENRLGQLFNMSWPKLKEEIATIPSEDITSKQHRPQHEILEELVAGIRNMELRFLGSNEDNPRQRHRRMGLPLVMIDELVERNSSDPMRFLWLASALRDEFPWINDLCLDLYRASFSESTSNQREAHRRLSHALQSIRHSQLGKEIRSDKILSIILHQLERSIFESRTNFEKSSDNIIKGMDIDNSFKKNI